MSEQTIVTGAKGSGGGGQDVFARKSSGLVRAASALDASLVNLYVATFPIMAGFMLGIVPGFYPGVNIPMAILLGALLALPITVAYALASTVMRRSGGDYIFISRAIHPALGFAANFVFVLFQTVFLTSTGYFLCAWSLAPLSRFLGVQLGNPGLVSFADTLTQPLSIFIIGEIAVIGFGLLFIFGNIRAVLKVFRYTFVVSVVGLIAVLAVLALSTPQGVQAAFDSYVHAANGTTGASAAIMKSAADNGFSMAPFALGATLLAITWPSFSLPYYVGSSYFAGEVRSGRYAQLLAGPLTLVAALIGTMLLVFVALNGIGQEFLGGLAAGSPSSIGLSSSPTYMELGAIASGNPIVGSLILIGFGSWLFPTVPMSLLIMTRCIFAWSMDRVTPEALTKVSPRTNSPFVAVILVTVVSAAVAWGWAYTSYFTVVVGAFGQVIALGLGCLAAAVIPYKFKSTYDLAPVGGYIRGIPTLTIAGIVGAVASVLIVVNFARDPMSGVNIDTSPGMFWFSLLLFPAGIVIYFLSRAIRRQQGYDLDLAYREIPPE